MVQDFFEESEKSVIDWTPITEHEKEGTRSGLAMALAECDKLLSHLLHLKGYKGKNVYERVASAKDVIHDIGGLAYALEVKENLFNEFDKEVTEKEIRRAIEKYKGSIRDVEQSHTPELGVVELVKRNLDYYFLSKPERFRRFVLGFLGTLFAVIILDNTHIGQTIIHLIARLVSGAISWIFVLAVLAALILIVSVVVMTLMGRKKG